MDRYLAFNLDSDQLSRGNDIISNLIRTEIYRLDTEWFLKLRFDDELVFLEPSLFYIFLSGIPTSRDFLRQYLFGYLSCGCNCSNIFVHSDGFGVCNFPNLGYIKQPNKSVSFFMDVRDIEHSIIPNEYCPISNIRLNHSKTDLLENNEKVGFLEPISETISKNITSLGNSFKIIQIRCRGLLDSIKLVTREIVLFNSPNHNSFAAISHHGTAYINTENKIQTIPFFIDEIAHQCGHIIFNVLTLDTTRFLRVNKEERLSKYVNSFGDKRTVYGAFHGLFTYTTILHALSSVLDDTEHLTELDRYEILGRIGFYMDKFNYDLKLLENASFFSEEGLFFYEQFRQSFLIVSEGFSSRLGKFRYYNQPYTFQLDRFLKANPIHGRIRRFGLF